jgi:hypothetical protein
MNDLDKQLIPHLEPIINQTLDMIEGTFDQSDFSWEGGRELLSQLQEEFGEYISMLSPQTQGRILEIHDKLSDIIDASDKETPIEDTI